MHKEKQGNTGIVVKNSTGGKESSCRCRRHGLALWVRKIPRSTKWQLTPVFLPENSMGRGDWHPTVHGATKSQTAVHTQAMIGNEGHKK